MSDTICKCPSCGGDIVDFGHFYGCNMWSFSAHNCRFAIQKEINGRTISEPEAKDLVEKGKTNILSGFKTKEGKVFSASIILQDKKTGKIRLDPSN